MNPAQRRWADTTRARRSVLMRIASVVWRCFAQCQTAQPAFRYPNPSTPIEPHSRTHEGCAMTIRREQVTCVHACGVIAVRRGMPHHLIYVPRDPAWGTPRHGSTWRPSRSHPPRPNPSRGPTCCRSRTSHVRRRASSSSALELDWFFWTSTSTAETSSIFTRHSHLPCKHGTPR